MEWPLLARIDCWLERGDNADKAGSSLKKEKTSSKMEIGRIQTIFRSEKKLEGTKITSPVLCLNQSRYLRKLQN